VLGEEASVVDAKLLGNQTAEYWFAMAVAVSAGRAGSKTVTGRNRAKISGRKLRLGIRVIAVDGLCTKKTRFGYGIGDTLIAV